MSSEIGSFITDTDGESGNTGGSNRTINPENGTSGNEGNVGSSPNLINGFASFEPAYERIPGNDTGNSGGESVRRTKTGKIDRRTKAGRNQAETQGDLRPVSNPGKLISLESAILGLHDMAASIFGIPELALDENEAKAMNDAVLEVSKYYVSAFDPKKVAIFNLAMCCGGIYTTRIMAYKNRLERDGKGKPQLVQTLQRPESKPTGKSPSTIEEYLQGMPPAEGASGY